MAATYEARQLEFAQGYEDFENSDLVRLILATGDWLERLVLQPVAVEAAMKALYRAVTGYTESDGRPDAPWRKLWTDLDSEFDHLRSSQYFVSLNAFAFWGLRPDLDILGIEPDLGRIADALEQYVSKGRALL